MIYSMTGYAAVARELPWGALALELRSVNHRYLDVSLRMPDELRAVEPALREAIAARLQRGKVECRLQLNAASGQPKPFELNMGLLAQLRALETKVRVAWPAAREMGVHEIVRWPGMLGSDTVPLEELRAATQELLVAALEELNATRAREGERLQALLLERLAGMQRIVAETGPKMPQILAAYSEKLATKLREALAGGDEERIRQEIMLFASKIDVDEELGRLGAHLAEARRILERGGAVGKRLDFLMQEFNREANTLGSKSVDSATSQASIELKILIEQMREQIQNIE